MKRLAFSYLFKTLLIIVLIPLSVSAQIPGKYDRSLLESELSKRNIDIAQFEERLSEEGIDLSQLESRPPNAVERNKIEEIINELSKPMRDSLVVQNPVLTKQDSLQQDKQAESEQRQDSIAAIEVSVFGQELFRRGVVKEIQSSQSLKAPESYILGTGDQLVISVWGRSQFESSYTIGEDGFIRILDGRMRVFLKGMSLADARNKLRQRFATEYSFKESEFEVTVNYARTVRVSILGEVFENPGTYTISGYNTVINALSLVKGPSDIGSLRNIKLQRSDGSVENVDIYAYITDPQINSQYYLGDNDAIIVPVVDKLVKISGSVRRPMKYELKNDEGMKALIEFAGGLDTDAFKRKIQLRRYGDGFQKLIDINWQEYLDEGQDFNLQDGDEVFVENIELDYRNYVSISGELEKPGRYERIDGMKISDLVSRAGLTPNSNTDLIYLQRENSDGTTRMIRLELDSILQNPGIANNLFLQDKDSLEVWSSERFADEASIDVNGAVRYGGKFPYDQDGNFRVSDAIIMAGGLSRDASRFATIHYNDPLNDKIKYYKTIDDITGIMDDNDHPDNYVLQAFDSLVVQSTNDIGEKFFVRVDGAVNKPGEFQYGEGMTIKDLLILAGGFQISAATNNIEVSRVIIRDNQPTEITVARLEMNKEFEILNGADQAKEFKLEPYDNIAVRFIKDFDLQDRVFIEGEVQVPGPYALNEKQMRISSLINRAGGLTPEAFPQGATLIRSENAAGAIVIKLDDIMNSPTSSFNLILKDGDSLFVPKVREFVTIRGATRVREVALDDNVSVNNTIRVPYFKGKDALFYINEFCGGFDELADKQKVFVEYPNGEIKYTKPGLFKRNYPPVTQGSVITVGYEEIKDEPSGESPKTDWTQVLSDSVGQALSILTLILLIQRID